MSADEILIFNLFFQSIYICLPILYSIWLKSYFFKSLNVFFIYSQFLAIRVYKLICLKAEFSIISISRELFVW